MKSWRLLIIFILLLNIGFVNADVISLNSGGTGNIILNPDTFIEGFFSCVPNTCSDLGYSCGSAIDSCGGTLDCGSCAAGYSCTSGSCVADSGGDGGTGGGGGGGGSSVPTNFLSVTPRDFTVNLAINTNKEEVITVRNMGASTRNVSVSQTGLDDNVILGEDYFSLGAGETKILDVTFVATSQTGVITGTINIDSVRVLVSLNVRTVLLLFDSNIIVLNENYIVPQKEDLETQVTLIPMGEKQRMDVTLNYEIKDYNGNIYLTKSETLLIEEQIEFERNFDTGSLPIGDYVIGLELIYPNGVAPSSAHFKVVEPLPTNVFAMIVMILVILIMIILIIIIILLIIRKIKENKKQQEISNV